MNYDKKTYYFIKCITPDCDNRTYEIWDEYIKNGDGYMECEYCGKDCVRTTANEHSRILVGNEATFDHPDNPNARWGKVIKIVAMSYIQVEFVGTGKVSEIRGLRR